MEFGTEWFITAQSETLNAIVMFAICDAWSFLACPLLDSEGVCGVSCQMTGLKFWVCQGFYGSGILKGWFCAPAVSLEKYIPVISFLSLIIHLMEAKYMDHHFTLSSKVLLVYPVRMLFTLLQSIFRQSWWQHPGLNLFSCQVDFKNVGIYLLQL